MIKEFKVGRTDFVDFGIGNFPEDVFDGDTGFDSGICPVPEQEGAGDRYDSFNHFNRSLPLHTFFGFRDFLVRVKDVEGDFGVLSYDLSVAVPRIGHNIKVRFPVEPVITRANPRPVVFRDREGENSVGFKEVKDFFLDLVFRGRHCYATIIAR